MAAAFDQNIMMSSLDAEALAARCPGARTAVVPNGVDTCYFAPDDTPEETALVYAGGMNMFANRDAVLWFLRETWPLIRAQVPAARFFAVGQDPPPELLAVAALDPQVVVTGKVPDVRPYIRRAAVYVVPLRVGGGTRLKVLDGLSLGKAMVSTSIGCEGIAVEPARHLLVADTPAAMADAAVSLLRSQEQRQQLGTAARQLIESRYAWPIIGRQLLSAYDEATARKREQ
jgi:glycosyltransferase involved in cell wall biosynthesis